MRERLRERPRILDAMAPKNESSAGEVGDVAVREYVEAGESMSGDIAPEDCDLVEPAVFVRIGGGG